MDMDITQVLNSLLPGSDYVLSSSVPPHAIIAWRDARECPSLGDMEEEWSKIKADNTPKKMTLRERVEALEEKTK